MKLRKRTKLTGLTTMLGTYLRTLAAVVKQDMKIFIPLLLVLFFVAILIYFFNFTSYLAPFVYSLF